jgi:hypothetical protein
MAAGTAAGAVVVAMTSWRVGVAVGLAVLCGESFGMLATAERIIAHREAASIEAAANTPAGKLALERLNDAREAMKRHDKQAAEAIARKDCGKECRGLLDRTRNTLSDEVEAARLAVERSTGARSTPLADRLGVEPWHLDLAMAGLLSIGANGLACVLIAWGAHGRRRAEPERPTQTAPPVVTDSPPVTDAGQPVVVPLKRRATGKDAARFALAQIKPGDGAVPLKAVADAYWAWCDGEGLTKPDMATTVAQIMALFGKAGVQTEMTAEREVVARGVTLAKG